MTLNIGQILGDAFGILRRRFLAMLGAWAVFSAAIFALLFLLGISAEGAASSAGLMGIVGNIIMSALTNGQTVAMTALASPLSRDSFGEALVTGFKGGLTMFVLTVVVFFLVLIVGLIFVLVFSIAAFAGGSVGAVIIGLLSFAGGLYFLCRLALLGPVIAVEKAFNPITAVNRAWATSRGHVVSLFVLLAIVLLGGLLVIGLPLFLMFAGGVGDGIIAGADAEEIATRIAAVGAGLLVIFPLAIVWQFFALALYAATHARLTDTTAERMAEVFE